MQQTSITRAQPFKKMKITRWGTFLKQILEHSTCILLIMFPHLTLLLLHINETNVSLAQKL